MELDFSKKMNFILEKQQMDHYLSFHCEIIKWSLKKMGQWYLDQLFQKIHHLKIKK